jgi:hypothetical protein
VRYVVGLETQASFVVAAMDLEVVRLLRGAIRAADLSAGGQKGPLGTIVSAPLCCRRDRFCPDPIIEPRRRIQPTPRYEPRRVIHPTTRDASAGPCCHCPPPPCPTAPVSKPAGEGPLPPPWRMPAWKIPVPAAPVVKVHIHRTDVHNKGSLIDLFL